MLVPFGIDDWPEGFREGSDPACPSFPCAVIESGMLTLRMNRQRFALPAVPSQDMSVDGQFDALLDHLLRLCPTWDQLSRSFLAGYFEFLREQIARHHAEIEARLAVFGGLFRPEHFLFSAPLPLPRAHLAEPAPEGAGRADIAFWMSGRWLALMGSPGRLMPTQARTVRERLAKAGVEIKEFSAAQISAGAPFFEAIFPEEERAFWDRETLPSGLAFRRVDL